MVDDLDILIKESKGRIEVEDLPPIEGDKIQARQLFQNLISNGLKFRKPNVPSVVLIKNVSRGNKIIEIHVEDNGIGFDEKYRSKIFKPFQRLHPRNEFGGTGMGLFIVNKIVSRFKGTISVKSQEGKGATFIILFPEP